MLNRALNTQLTVGVDICEVARFTEFEVNSAFTQKVFTTAELNQCQAKPNLAESLAVRFAGKEAIQKSLAENIPYNQIEILTDAHGKPKASLLDPTLKTKYDIEVSLSHTKTLAQAFCLTQSLVTQS